MINHLQSQKLPLKLSIEGIFFVSDIFCFSSSWAFIKILGSIELMWSKQKWEIFLLLLSPLKKLDCWRVEKEALSQMCDQQFHKVPPPLIKIESGWAVLFLYKEDMFAYCQKASKGKVASAHHHLWLGTTDSLRSVKWNILKWGLVSNPCFLLLIFFLQEQNFKNRKKEFRTLTTPPTQCRQKDRGRYCTGVEITVDT